MPHLVGRHRAARGRVVLARADVRGLDHLPGGLQGVARQRLLVDALPVDLQQLRNRPAAVQGVEVGPGAQDGHLRGGFPRPGGVHVPPQLVHELHRPGEDVARAVPGQRVVHVREHVPEARRPPRGVRGAAVRRRGLVRAAHGAAVLRAERLPLRGRAAAPHVRPDVLAPRAGFVGARAPP